MFKEVEVTDQFLRFINQGILPQANSKCITCSEQVKPVVTRSEVLGDMSVIPSECNKCRLDSFENHLVEVSLEDFSNHKCCGYQNKLVKHCGDTPIYETISKSYEYQRAMISYITSVIDGNEPKGALMMGSVGTGKTFLCKIMHNTLVTERKNSCFIKMVDLALVLRKETFGDNYKTVLNEFKNVETLIIDDYGTQKNTDWVKETLFSILDYRYENLKRTILTTNLGMNQIDDMEPRLASRLRDFKWLLNIEAIGQDLRLGL